MTLTKSSRKPVAAARRGGRVGGSNLLTMHGGQEPGARAWSSTIHRRIGEIRSGAVQGIRAKSRRQDPADRRPVKPHAFHPEADAEYAEAAQHYAQIQPDWAALLRRD